MLDETLSGLNALISPSLPPISTPPRDGRHLSRARQHGPGSARRSPRVPHSDIPTAGSVPLLGPSPRSRRVGYTVDMTSQKLYMSSLNKNRFRASLSFEEFEAGLQEAVQEQKKEEAARFDALKHEQEEKERRLELALARAEQAEQTVQTLTKRLRATEESHAADCADTQAQVQTCADHAAGMVELMGRIRSNVENSASQTGADKGSETTDADVQVCRPVPPCICAQFPHKTLAPQAMERKGAAGVMERMEKLAEMEALVKHMMAKLSEGEQESGAASPDREAVSPEDSGPPQSPPERLLAASDKIAQMEEQVKQLEGQVRVDARRPSPISIDLAPAGAPAPAPSPASAPAASGRAATLPKPRKYGKLSSSARVDRRGNIGLGEVKQSHVVGRSRCDPSAPPPRVASHRPARFARPTSSLMFGGVPQLWGIARRKPFQGVFFRCNER